MERKGAFKELAQIIGRAGKFETHGADQQAANLRQELMLQS